MSIFSGTDSDFIPLIIQLAVTSLIFGLFTDRRFKLKISGLNWFVAIFFFLSIRSLYEIIIRYVLIPIDYDKYHLLKHAHFIFYSFCLLTFFFYIEGLSQVKPRYWLTALVFSLWSIFIVLYFLLLFDKVDLDFHGFIRFFFDLMQIVIIASALQIYIKIHIRALYQPLKKALLSYIIALSLIFLLALIEISEFITHHPTPAALLFSIIFLYVAVFYSLNPYFVYLVPYDTYRIMLLNSAGLIIYSTNLKQSETQLDDVESLLGGAITALEGFLKTILNSSQSLNLIRLEDRSMMIIKNEFISVVAIVEKPSLILKRSLIQFLKEIKTEFPSLNTQKSHLVIDHELETKIAQIITRCFPFTQSLEIEPIDLYK